eukprot:snap_masked-scaffold_10-processed-gene-2.31-mRNA-1 protein AED:1.00 eAED:1.00 QI:0/0/0/0/1/1/4/0/84
METKRFKPQDAFSIFFFSVNMKLRKTTIFELTLRLVFFKLLVSAAILKFAKIPELNSFWLYSHVQNWINVLPINSSELNANYRF